MNPFSRSARALTLAKRGRVAAAIAAVALIGIGVAVFGWQDAAADADGIPTAAVRNGDVTVEVHATAEVRAARAALLSAPGITGALQIVEIAPTGGRVRAGDTVVQFDPAEQEYQLSQSRSQLAQAVEDLRKLDDDTTVKQSQHEIDIMKAKFALRRAELDLRSNELVGKIQSEKNQLAYDEAKRRLEQLQADASTLTADARASRAALEEKRNKSQLDVEGAERNIERMTLTAPFDGIVIAQENRDAAGGIFFFGMTMPEYRQGDVVQPGRPVAELFDPGALDVIARIGEADGSNVSPGQSAKVQLYPDWDRTLEAKVVSVGGGGPRRFWEANTRQMELVLRVTGDAKGLQPGWSGTVVITGDSVRQARFVPRQALVDRDGKSLVYVRQGNGFVATPVKVSRRTETAAVVEGLAEGTVVALRNPDSETAKPAGSAPASPAGGRAP
jgi:HlyD family secretion protein